nr:rrna biogenesis protein rrp5 [Quercus suber]
MSRPSLCRWNLGTVEKTRSRLERGSTFRTFRLELLIAHHLDFFEARVLWSGLVAKNSAVSQLQILHDMAPIKRKAVSASDARSVKKVKANKTNLEEKFEEKITKPVKSSKLAKNKAVDDGEQSDERRPVVNSILQSEDRAFPRGGASVLTPIEQKQIKAQAERDVLYEQQTGLKVSHDGEDEDLFDENHTEEEAARTKKKARKSKREDVKDKTKVGGPTVRIQGLSYKTLTIGSTVLGRVTAITSKDVALALCNNLTGFVPITSISEILSNRIETLLATEETGKSIDDDKDVDLHRLFHIGQWLRAEVTATSSEPAAASKSRRHIELSLDPRQTNGGLSAEHVVVNSMIQCAVRSVEDHGIVMDLGLSDSDVKGFVSKKDIGTAYDLEKLEEGQVVMCLVTGKGSNGKVLKLTPDATRFSANLTADKKSPIVNEAPVVDSFLPGMAVNILVTDVLPGGVAGKIMGMLDVTADLIHIQGTFKESDLSKKYKVGSKIKARITFAIPKDDGGRKLGISLLDHMLVLPPVSSKLAVNASAKERTQASELEQQRPDSSIVDDAKVTRVITERGLFLSLPTAKSHSLTAFAHISQVSDERIDSLTSSSGAYKLDSTHRARIVSYNPLDNIYYVSLKTSVLDQTFLRLEDVAVGTLVKGTVDRILLGGKSGIIGILVKLSESVSGLVPEMHLSDVKLQHPERKFKEGSTVTARVLSVDTDKRQLRLTLKKMLISQDDDAARWSEYANLKPGMESKGTVINIIPSGAVIQFYGNVRAYLPVAEMADTFVKRPEDHVQVGKTVSVRVLSVNAKEQEMKVSCKDDGAFDENQQDSWAKMTAGQLISGRVTEKNNEGVSVETSDGLKGSIRQGHLSDGTSAKAENAMKHIRVGQTLSDLVVLLKMDRSRHLVLSRKASLVEPARSHTLLCSIEDAKKGMKVRGFVRNITPEGIYTEFANGLVGLVSKSQIPPELTAQPAFGLVKDQTVHAWISHIDETRGRIGLSMREQKDVPVSTAGPSAQQTELVNPVDTSIASTADLTIGKVTKARIAAIKGTQLNVRLADGVRGRVDISEAFDDWEQVTNKQHPLHVFEHNQVLDVKVLGMHDSKSHRFLPISHRQAVVSDFELSAKASRIETDSQDLLTMDTIKPGASYLAFMSSYGDNFVWVSLSPKVRGRISLMDLSGDLGALQNLAKHFPVGCALRVTVKNVDAAANRLDLSARTTEDKPTTLEDISVGMVLPARVTKSTERGIIVQLSDSLVGFVPLSELSDDYELADPAAHDKNSILRVSVVDIDAPNKKITLSLRPSKVLSSVMPVQDRQITTIAQVKPGDIVRGFVKNVAAKGVIVSLGAHVDAFVHMRNVSDKFVKDWQSVVEVDRLVKGRILTVDVAGGRVEMSLKESTTDANYKPPMTINDLKEGMIVTGKVRKVEAFGAFIDIDNTQPRISGLCHKSEVASRKVDDVSKLYSEGDVVKTKILKVDLESRRINLGLKATYFTDAIEEEDDEDPEDESDGDSGVPLNDDDSDDVDMDGGVALDNVRDMDSHDEEVIDEMDIDDKPTALTTSGLKTTGFDWAGDAFEDANGAVSDSDAEAATTKKKKRSKAEIKVDMTGDLDKYGPRSVSDFERQLLGQPNDSGLWIQYMAFQLELSEIQKARDIAERALRTIHIREGEEKANIWIAWLNLEVEYGDDDSVEEVFQQACQLQDSLEMHGKLASIYIDSGKHSKADDIFTKIVANKSFRGSPDVWLNYATFLMQNLNEPARARALLSRALQSIPTNGHRLLTANFAALEFHSANGDTERGRTIFENLIAEWPKWSSGWDMWVDLERSRLSHLDDAGGDEDKTQAKEQVRQLFERMSKQKMKKRRAKFVFKRWLEFEEAAGDEKSAERVKVLAREFVEALQAKGRYVTASNSFASETPSDHRKAGEGDHPAFARAEWPRSSSAGIVQHGARSRSITRGKNKEHRLPRPSFPLFFFDLSPLRTTPLTSRTPAPSPRKNLDPATRKTAASPSPRNQVCSTCQQASRTSPPIMSDYIPDWAAAPTNQMLDPADDIAAFMGEVMDWQLDLPDLVPDEAEAQLVAPAALCR